VAAGGPSGLRGVLELLGLSAALTLAAVPVQAQTPIQTQVQAQVQTQTAPAPNSAPAERGQQEPAEEPTRSALDALLFYQLLIGEIELRQGQPGVAFEVLMDAARRTRQEQVFRRAAELALQARSGDRALAAVRAWRQALPDSQEAVRLQLQILSALNRPGDAAEPLRFLLTRSPEGERSGLIASLPRFFQQAADPKAVATMLEGVLQPHLQSEATRVAAGVALGRAWLRAGDAPRALTLVRRAHTQDTTAVGPVLAALDLMSRAPEAESIVKAFLAAPQAETAVRLAYARALVQAQRLGDAVTELEVVTRQQPAVAPPWLMLGSLQVELKHPQQAEQALERYLALVEKPTAPEAPKPTTAPGPASDDDGDDDDGDAQGGTQGSTQGGTGAGSGSASADGIAQARMLLAQAAEQRNDDAAAEAHLAKIDQPRRLLEVQTRRAGILARQGRIEQARELLRKAPERTENDARAKLVAEAQVLRDVKRWGDAYTVLEQAVTRWPQDVDLLYEQAMVAEKLDRLAEMETLLRRVMQLKPDHQHAYNALGYSLADRGLRLEEARALIVKALELAPGDPFITDSLGWVEFRLGRPEEALRLLREAYRARPDTEIAAHLGEVLWVLGRHDEARAVWREGRARDAGNEVLRETLVRLQQNL
jgi:tetratricopeptide (TPR) repeat protein